MQLTWVTFLGIAIAVFGSLVLAYSSVLTKSCWGTIDLNYNNYRDKTAISHGTIYAPFTCSFWISPILIGIASLLSGASLYAYGHLKARSVAIL